MDGSAAAAPKADVEALVDRLRATLASGRTKPLAWRREQLRALGYAVVRSAVWILFVARFVRLVRRRVLRFDRWGEGGRGRSRGCRRGRWIAARTGAA